MNRNGPRSTLDLYQQNKGSILNNTVHSMADTFSMASVDGYQDGNATHQPNAFNLKKRLMKRNSMGAIGGKTATNTHFKDAAATMTGTFGTQRNLNPNDLSIKDDNIEKATSLQRLLVKHCMAVTISSALASISRYKNDAVLYKSLLAVLS